MELTKLVWMISLLVIILMATAVSQWIIKVRFMCFCSFFHFIINYFKKSFQNLFYKSVQRKKLSSCSYYRFDLKTGLTKVCTCTLYNLWGICCCCCFFFIHSETFNWIYIRSEYEWISSKNMMLNFSKKSWWKRRRRRCRVEGCVWEC